MTGSISTGTHQCGLHVNGRTWRKIATWSVATMVSWVLDMHKERFSMEGNPAVYTLGKTKLIKIGCINRSMKNGSMWVFISREEKPSATWGNDVSADSGKKKQPVLWRFRRWRRVVRDGKMIFLCQEWHVQFPCRLPSRLGVAQSLRCCSIGKNVGATSKLVIPLSCGTSIAKAKYHWFPGRSSFAE